MIFNQSILNIEIDDGGLDDTIVRSRIQTYPWGEESPRAYPTFGFESSNPLGEHDQLSRSANSDEY